MNSFGKQEKKRNKITLFLKKAVHLYSETPKGAFYDYNTYSPARKKTRKHLKTLYMEFTGRIIAVLEARSGVARTTGNPWMMQDYVIEETVGQYPKRMCFNVFGEDKIKAMNIQVGQELTVSFDVNAREYQGRWYNDIRAWKVEPAAQAAPAPAAEPVAPFPPAQPAAPAAPAFEAAADETSDLPF